MTVCRHRRACLFGEIVNSAMSLNPFGAIVEEDRRRLPSHYLHLELDVFVMMPNHLHGLLLLKGDNNHRIPDILRAYQERRKAPAFRHGERHKSFSARRINQMRQSVGVPVWQTTFYDPVGRDESDMPPIREYIVNNPARWAEDVENHADG